MVAYVPSEQDLQDLENRFTYHSPLANQPERYKEIRNVAKELAKLYLNTAPKSRELSLALTKLEESVMWANASIARNEKGE